MRKPAASNASRTAVPASSAIAVAAVSLLACLLLVGVAFATERHYNRDLERDYHGDRELEVGSDQPVGNR